MSNVTELELAVAEVALRDLLREAGPVGDSDCGTIARMVKFARIALAAIEQPADADEEREWADYKADEEHAWEQSMLDATPGLRGRY